MPVKRWVPRRSGICGGTSEDHWSQSSPPPTRTTPTSVSSQAAPDRPFVSTSTATYSASAVGVDQRSRVGRCTPQLRRNGCSLSAGLVDRADEDLIHIH